MADKTKAAESKEQATDAPERDVAYEPATSSKMDPERQQAKLAKNVAKVMVYTHPKIAKKIKEIALHSDRKANDVYLEAIDAYLMRAGYKGIKFIIEN